MDIKVQPMITLRMEHADFRIVGLALSGKLRPPDIKQALELNARLTAAYSTQLNALADAADHRADVAQEMEDE